MFVVVWSLHDDYCFFMQRFIKTICCCKLCPFSLSSFPFLKLLPLFSIFLFLPKSVSHKIQSQQATLHDSFYHALGCLQCFQQFYCSNHTSFRLMIYCRHWVIYTGGILGDFLLYFSSIVKSSFSLYNNKNLTPPPF